MFLVEESSQTGLSRHLTNHVFGPHNFGNTKALRVIFFSKYSKSNLDFRKAEKNSEKLSRFLDNCI